MFIQTSDFLKQPKEIHADSLGTLAAQLSLADMAVLLEAKHQQLLVFLGMRGNVCLTSEVESVTVLQSPEFREISQKLPSADIVKLVPKDYPEKDTPDEGA